MRPLLIAILLLTLALASCAADIVHRFHLPIGEPPRALP